MLKINRWWLLVGVMFDTVYVKHVLLDYEKEETVVFCVGKSGELFATN